MYVFKTFRQMMKKKLFDGATMKFPERKFNFFVRCMKFVSILSQEQRALFDIFKGISFHKSMVKEKYELS